MSNEPRAISSVCVCLGSRFGQDPGHRTLASELGHQLARNNIGVIFGGSKCGLMGALADAVVKERGSLTAVTTVRLAKLEGVHGGAAVAHRVRTMDRRMDLMFRLADALIVLPGGFGTLQELFTFIVKRQLGELAKPCIVLDTGHYAGLHAWLGPAVVEGGFADPRDVGAVTLCKSVHDVIGVLMAPSVPGWSS